ncbi:hypothetical protein QNH20_25485 [Neobacillus sp. WH10]|uniref:hypothetical protein n=1 Tax=Neobacillus sp. WH10 TaxID=3047873 RepID=UPI0024C1FD80|nr:hypothetical protein [Neobacillus sp. WH10]WHY77376.1 hypothetical protein QNH20_25485 [Neobacillus sp. WH10]
MTVGSYILNKENLKNSKVSKEKIHHSKTQFALFCLIVASSLGEIINIYGIKLSWIMAILTMALFIVENFSNRIIISTYDIKKYIYFFIFWFFYATLQMLFIFQNDYAISSYLTLVVNIFIVMMIALNIHSIEDLIFLNRGLILGLTINLFIAFWEITTGNHIISVSIENQLYNYDKPYGVFGNINDFATFICLGIVSLILNYALTKTNKIFTVITIIAAVFVLLEIDARAPIYGMVLYGVSLVLFYILVKLYKIGKSTFKIVSFMLLFISILASTIIFANYSLEELVLLLSTPANVNSDLLRIRLIEGAVKGFINSAFLGVGPGQSILLLGINVHNFYLEIMCEYGIFIFGGIIMIFIYFLRVYRWKLPNLLTVCIMSFTPAFFVIGISSSGANRIRATWIMISFLYIAISIYKKKQIKVR